MPKERENPGQTFFTDSVSEFLIRDTNRTLSETQMEAFQKGLNALPEGKLKEFAKHLEEIQFVSSKINEFVIRGYDIAWKIAMPFIAINAPFVAGLPQDPFSKLAKEGMRLGGTIGERAIKTTVKGTEKIKAGIEENKTRKKEKIKPSLSSDK